MKFSSILEKRLFVKMVSVNITDEALLTNLELTEGIEIPDELYYQLSDDTLTIAKEIRLKHEEKTFFKDLRKDSLDVFDLPALNSYTTHIFIALKQRFKVRSNVDVTSAMTMRKKINSLIDSIISTGKSNNSIKQYIEV